MSDAGNDVSVVITEDEGTWAVEVTVNGTPQVPRFFGDKSQAEEALGRLAQYEEALKQSA